MTREKYETLPLSELKGIAKVRGLKGCSTLRKAEIIDRMLAEDARIEAEKAAEEAKKAAAEAKKASSKQAAATAKKETKADKKPQDKATVKKGRDSVRTSKNTRLKTNKEEDGSAAAETMKKAGSTEDTVNVSAEDNNVSQIAAAPKAEAADVTSEEAIAAAEKAEERDRNDISEKPEINKLDSGLTAEGILEVMPEGFGFIRSDNFLPGENDVYVSPSQIRRFGLKTGDVLRGNTRIKSQNEKFSALLYVNSINGLSIAEASRRASFEDLTPVFPNERIKLENPNSSLAMRIVDLLSPIGKGQRGMIVSPPKAGKTTLLKEIAMSILKSNPEMHIMILLIDERPEEVTDMKETVYGPNVEVIYSTFDELPDHHRRVSEMVIERAKRLVESKRDVIILIDSITRLARAYNQVVQSSGRTLSGGLDPSALHMPKRFFGAARNIREGGSLTILATALVDTGSKMDDVVYEEFKGTGNMELVLDRKLQERRVFPAIDIVKSGTRREDLLLSREELEAINKMRRALNGSRSDDAMENILNMFAHTRSNAELIRMILRQKII